MTTTRGFCMILLTIVFGTAQIAVAQNAQQQSLKQRLQVVNELRQRDELSLRHKVHPEIWQKANAGNTVAVIVSLSVSLPRQKTPTAEDDLVRAQAIATVRDELIGKLRGKYRVLRSYEYVPAVALEVTADVLAELENSELVERVRENRVHLLP
jgi:hypothetical protein